jgi:DNA-binding IclR family transcriptional regulator
MSLREAAMPVMEDLYTIVGQHIQLGVMEGDEVLFVDPVERRRVTRPGQASTDGTPTTITAGDVVMTATLNDSQVAQDFAATVMGALSSVMYSMPALRSQDAGRCGRPSCAVVEGAACGWPSAASSLALIIDGFCR